jgi:hypothetical protein
LPGEDLASFAQGFDRLARIAPQEIQVGILKRLRGTPIARHTEAHAMRYNPDPPYNVLATGSVGFADMQRVTRFARYWELVGNSGRFTRTLPLLLGDAPFDRFMSFSDWLFATTGKTHEFALERLYELLHAFLREHGIDATASLTDDYLASGARGAPGFIEPALRPRPSAAAASDRRSARQARQSMMDRSRGAARGVKEAS